MKAVWVTRDTGSYDVRVWPETVGIRKFHGCVQYGAAWRAFRCTAFLYKKTGNYIKAELLTKTECKKRFGFFPRTGTAWYINTKGKRTKEEIDFSP